MQSKSRYMCHPTHTALSFDLVGEDVLITGAGPIGCMAATICRHAGARFVVITDVNDYRLDIAKKMGATRVVNVTKLKSGLNVEPVITHRFKIDDYNEAFEIMRSGMSGKVILDWT